MTYGVEAIDNSQVLGNIDAILSEIEKALSGSNVVNVENTDKVASSDIKIVSAREEILKTV